MNESFLKRHSRVIGFIATTLTLFGLLSFFVMPRQEDPKIRNRNAVATLTLPGATPEKIERLVVRPLENSLAGVAELKEVDVEARLNVAILRLTLKDDVSDLETAWREVERAFDRAKDDLPAEVGEPKLDFKVLEVESVVVAITGSEDLLKLREAALTVKDAILSHPDVSSVKIFGDPGVEVSVVADPKAMDRHGVGAGQIYTTLRRNNLAQATGFLVRDGQRLVLEQDNDAQSLDEFRRLRLETGRLEEIELSSIAKIDLSVPTPPETLFRWNGQAAVGIGIVAKDQINVVAFGDSIRQRLSELGSQIAPLKIEMVAFQPARTDLRLRDLLFSLVSGVALIFAFLSFSMGVRTAVIVAASVPAISLIGLFGFFLAGGVIQQISIAAFVISIGQFIDNIVVVVDSVQRKLSTGMSSDDAAEEAFRELRLPMIFATLTGACAFLPMLASQGNTSDFVFSFPLVAVITLVVSCFFAIFVAPLLAGRLLESGGGKIRLPLHRLETLFADLAMGSFSRVVFLSLALVAVSASSFLFIKKEFFPESDRSEFLLSFELAPGADIASTDKLLREVESLLKQEKSVTSVAAFAGGSIPRFYYNLPNPMRAPQSGQVLITTRNLSDVKPLGTKLESQLQAAHPDVDVVAHFLQQGPPINAKIEVQFFSPSADRRQQVLGEIEKAYRADASLRAIRGDLDLPLNVQSFNAREERLAQAGLTREDLNLALAFHSSGLVATQFRSGRELIPVRLKSLDHVRTNDSALANALALRGRARDYRISELATSQIRQELSLVRRLNSERYGRAMADLKSGETFDRALERLRPRIESIKLLPGERLEFAGDAKGAGEANTSIFKVVPMALLFLFAFLLLEFRSLRKVAIALIALPITILGAFPGLFLGGAPFGFMSLLGVLALVGIAVNNIILLLEAMENGKSVREAIAVRFRAIFLTTVLTLLGLIPLTLDASSLWPPLAWTMISGLFTGTLVTLIVVPALYRAMYASQSVGMNLGLLLVIGATFGLSTNSRAEAVNAASAVSIEFLMEQVENSPEDQASRAAVSAKDSLERAAQYGAFLPRVTAGGEVSRRDRDLTTQSPLGPITAEEKNRFQGQIEIQQPIFDKAEMFDLRQTARLQKEAAEQKRRHERAEIQYAVGARAIEILILERQARFMEDSINLLQSRRRDIVRLVAKGRLSSTDLLKIDLSITTLDQKKNDLRSQIENFKVELAQRLGRAEIASIRIPAAPLEKNLSEVASLDSRVSDAEALALDGQALRHQARAVGASHLPTLDAFARWTRVDGTRVLEKNWGEVGIGLKWEIFGAGRRGPQAQALGAQAVALDAQALALRRTRALEESEATRRIQDRLTWRSRMESLRPQAQSIREAEAKRYFEGRGSLNDLVDADSVFLEISRDIELSELEASLACLRLTSLKTQKVNTSCAVESP